MTAIFEKTLVRAGQIRSFALHRGPEAGWHSFERAGEQDPHRQHYTDWHQVERVLERFRRSIAELRHEGWHEPETRV